MSRVIGIDLGTTNCCVAAVVDGQPRVFRNRQGYTTTPSVVAITEEGERIVGQLASRQSITNPEATVHAAKRLIGRPFNDPRVQRARETMPYEIVEGPGGDARVSLRGRMYAIPEISAMLLQEMRVVAEEALEERVNRAVVTVPAYFNDAQRQAVRQAGKVCGLDVPRIINEPTAAALAYGHQRGQSARGSRMVVYDLGGGPFDVTVLQVTGDGIFEVIATTGDSYLGGEDFDERIVDWLVQGFRDDHDVDLRDSPISYQRLKQAAQKAKMDLSEVVAAEVQLPFIVSSGPKAPLNLHYGIERPQLEAMTEDLVDLTLDIAERACKMAGIATHDVDDVLLVGGMTRMPLVQRKVGVLFGRPPSRGIHPDEAVAIGAAIQGDALAREASGILLRDVTAHSLGLATHGDVMDVMIPANQRIPTRVPSVFTTSRDHQTRIRLRVLQGESDRASENTLLKDISVPGLRSARAGEVDLEVTFEIDHDGIFQVSAKDPETGKAVSVEVRGHSGLDVSELTQAARESMLHLEQRRGDETTERDRQTVEVALAALDRIFPAAYQSLAADPDMRLLLDQAQQTYRLGRTTLEQGDTEALGKMASLLEETRATLQRAIDKS
ncbi:MAG: Hsp70 family protein [Myxococcota bacterium]